MSETDAHRMSVDERMPSVGLSPATGRRHCRTQQIVNRLRALTK